MTRSGSAFHLSSLIGLDPVETPGFWIEDLPHIRLLQAMALHHLLIYHILSLVIMSVAYGLFACSRLQM